MSIEKINTSDLNTKRIDGSVEYEVPGKSPHQSHVIGRIDGVSHDIDNDRGVVTTVTVRLDQSQMYKVRYTGQDTYVGDSLIDHLRLLSEESVSS